MNEINIGKIDLEYHMKGSWQIIRIPVNSKMISVKQENNCMILYYEYKNEDKNKKEDIPIEILTAGMEFEKYNKQLIGQIVMDNTTFIVFIGII